MSNHLANFEHLPDWLSPAEVSAYLKLGRSTVYELIRSEAIYARKFGRVLRVPKRALQPMVCEYESKKNGGTSCAG